MIDAAQDRLDSIAARLSTASAHAERATTDAQPDAIVRHAATTPERFAEMVRTAKAYIAAGAIRSEEHTSELQSLMRTSYAVFCLKQTKNDRHQTNDGPLYTIRN